MSGYMFHDEMVKRMMKSTVNPDAQILETAYETGRKQGEAETVKAVLEIINENNNILADAKKQLIMRIEALKGGE